MVRGNSQSCSGRVVRALRGAVLKLLEDDYVFTFVSIEDGGPLCGGVVAIVSLLPERGNQGSLTKMILEHWVSVPIHFMQPSILWPWPHRVY